MKSTRQSRSTKIPIPWQSYRRQRADNYFFGPDDVKAIQSMIERQLIASVGDAVKELNVVADCYLTTYAHYRLPTADSKTAEWCEAIAGDLAALLERLGSPDKGYPERTMPLETSMVLTNRGPQAVVEQYEHQALMKLGDDPSEVLDRVPAALWSLKQIATFAARQYRTSPRSSRSNAYQPQNSYLLDAVVRFLHSKYGMPVPNRRPNPSGPLFRALNFMRGRIVEKVKPGPHFTNIDLEAVKRLSGFTRSAAASLWVREGARIRAGIRH